VRIARSSSRASRPPPDGSRIVVFLFASGPRTMSAAFADSRDPDGLRYFESSLKHRDNLARDCIICYANDSDVVYSCATCAANMCRPCFHRNGVELGGRCPVCREHLTTAPPPPSSPRQF